MPDAKLLQVLCRQARKNRLVYLIFAECSLILPEAQVRSKTTTSMTAPTQRCAHHRAVWGECLGGPEAAQ